MRVKQNDKMFHTEKNVCKTKQWNVSHKRIYVKQNNKKVSHRKNVCETKQQKVSHRKECM